jgi:hypothetical protein
VQNAQIRHIFEVWYALSTMNDHELTEIWYIDMYLLGSLELLQCNDNIDPQPPNLSFAHP